MSHLCEKEEEKDKKTKTEGDEINSKVLQHQDKLNEISKLLQAEKEAHMQTVAKLEATETQLYKVRSQCEGVTEKNKKLMREQKNNSNKTVELQRQLEEKTETANTLTAQVVELEAYKKRVKKQKKSSSPHKESEVAAKLSETETKLKATEIKYRKVKKDKDVVTTTFNKNIEDLQRELEEITKKMHDEPSNQNIKELEELCETLKNENLALTKRLELRDLTFHTPKSGRKYNSPRPSMTEQDNDGAEDSRLDGRTETEIPPTLDLTEENIRRVLGSDTNGETADASSEGLCTIITCVMQQWKLMMQGKHSTRNMSEFNHKHREHLDFLDAVFGNEQLIKRCI